MRVNLLIIIGTIFTATMVILFPVLIRKYNAGTKNCVFFLGLYITVIFILTLGIRSYNTKNIVNLQLFHCYERIWDQLTNSIQKYGHRYDLQQIWLMRHGICNILMNIILFLPLGYLIPLVSKRIDRFWKMLCLGFLFTLIIELFQLVTHRGWFDVDDLFHNTIGAGLGWFLYRRIYGV